MATNFTTNVSPHFDMDAFAAELEQLYRTKGFAIRTTKLSNGIQMVFDKGCGGINMLLGMGLGITASITVSDGVLSVNYTDEEWTGKIIGLVVGWFLCLIPFVTAVIGAIQQMDLSKNINNDITLLVGKQA
ncbi:MAG: hypothetical protein IJY42_02000 [Clostridia bacterium]|nr:hypothetical protein [Clostridia bacterium]